MIKTILLCTDGSPHSQVASRYAIYLATELKAALRGLHVLDSRMLEGPLMADISGWIGAQPYGAQLQQFRQILESKGDAVIQALEKECSEAGIVYETAMKMGHPSRVMLEEETKAELVVIGQKGEHADFMGDLMGSNADRLTRHSIKPCLVTGPSFRPIRSLLIAYDGSAHASQALHEAVELAVALSASLRIITVSEGHQRPDAREIAESAMKLALAHDCEAERIIAEGKPDDAILREAEQSDCDLIVVGAHGHGRIREMFLGSTTTYIITRSERPVMVVR